jgi:hypothetical protein
MSSARFSERQSEILVPTGSTDGTASFDAAHESSLSSIETNLRAMDGIPNDFNGDSFMVQFY